MSINLAARIYTWPQHDESDTTQTQGNRCGREAQVIVSASVHEPPDIASVRVPTEATKKKLSVARPSRDQRNTASLMSCHSTK